MKEKIIAWLRDYFKAQGGPMAVVGISGGTDSSVTAALLAEALGPEKVMGVLMPCGVQHDLDVALALVRHLGIPYRVVNIEAPVRALSGIVGSAMGFDPEERDVYKTNTPARVRMTVLYGICGLLGGRVANTCNLSEDYVGYSTKFGDAAGDFAVLSTLTKTEVRELGRELGLPEIFVEKIPEDGMSGRSDEEKLGFTYAVLDRYIRTGEIDDEAIKEKIDRMHQSNLHKLLPMPGFGKEEGK